MVFMMDKGGNGTYNIELAVPELKNNENASLFARLQILIFHRLIFLIHNYP